MNVNKTFKLNQEHELKRLDGATVRMIPTSLNDFKNIHRHHALFPARYSETAERTN